MAIRVNLNFGLPEEIGNDLFFPIPASEIDSHKSGWTTYELAKIVFDGIAQDFPNDGQKIANYIESMEDKVTLEAFGPEDGDYLVVIPHGAEIEQT